MKIAAQGICVQFGGKTALQDAGLTVTPGELLGLIGPNGAGKSTLLRTLARLQAYESGTVLYDGQHPTAFKDTELARRIAYLAQAETVCWPLTVENIVALGRLPHRGFWGGMSALDHAAIEQAMALVDIAALRDRPLPTLSVGERSRVLLARALAVQAQVLLVDEPIAALDPYHQLRIMELLRDQARQGCAIIAVLHDLTHALRFCDRLVLLDQGRVLAAGMPNSVLSEALLRNIYRITAVRGEYCDGRFLIPWERHAPNLPDQTVTERPSPSGN